MNIISLEGNDIYNQKGMAKQVKPLPGLEPIDFIDVINPRMLKQWLGNKTIWWIWRDASKIISANAQEYKQLLDLAKDPSLYKDVDPILIGKTIKEYTDQLLKDWTEGTSDDVSADLVASLPLFVEMSKFLPHVNPSEEYQTAFRGTDISDTQLRTFIKANSNPKDWKKVKIGGVTWMGYTGPKAKLFTYKPHRPTQSWSVSEESAVRFGTAIVATPLDKTFFFDPAFMNQYGYKFENETVHFGKQPMKVSLVINKRDYDTFMEMSWFFSEEAEPQLTETIQVQDEEGTLIMPI